MKNIIFLLFVGLLAGCTHYRNIGTHTECKETTTIEKRDTTVFVVLSADTIEKSQPIFVIDSNKQTRINFDTIKLSVLTGTVLAFITSDSILKSSFIPNDTVIPVTIKDAITIVTTNKEQKTTEIKERKQRFYNNSWFLLSIILIFLLIISIRRK